MMDKEFKRLRLEYFKNIANLVKVEDVQFLIVTHILKDRPELLEAIAYIGEISAVVAVPYSIDDITFKKLRKKYNIITPSLADLYDDDYLINTTLQNLRPNKPVIILEIGGYFARIISTLNKRLNGSILGVVEDTESGHREYEKVANKLPCPVVSVARSDLKESEDCLIGVSCVYSTEKLLRAVGFPIEGKRSLVLGYGKIGRSTAYAAAKHNCPVEVYDINPTLRILALSEGFHVPEYKVALEHADIVYGTTGKLSIPGEYFPRLKDGAILTSCSSKDIEFDMTALKKTYIKKRIVLNFDKYTNNRHRIYLLADGRPVNFIDGAIVGPILALAQAEIVFSINTIFKLSGKKGLFENNDADKRILSNKWLSFFCDESSGHYKHA